MPTGYRSPSSTLSLAKVACVVVVFCAAMAIASPAQTFTTLVTMTGQNGPKPYATLVQGSDGNFYGTTFEGGSSNGPCGTPGYGCGTIYKITPNGILTTMYNFCSQKNCTDGYAPWGALVLGTDGNFYGTTTNGGGYNGGTFFRITPTGTLTTLYAGSGSSGGLIQASDGNFYGTDGGGTYGDGTVFRITPSGTLTTLHNFDGADGSGPEAGLVQATDGNLYGTTTYGGSNNFGTVFRITLNGALTTLHSFDGIDDGGYLKAGLVQATDGNLYGDASWGGSNGGNGTIFRITLDGAVTVVYNFAGTDGSSPEAALMQATDGDFYGTTWSGGANGAGTVFQLTPAGVLTTLHSFDFTDGNFPQAGLLQASNGNLYGVASGNNAPPLCSPYGVCGTVFSVAIAPTPLQFIPVAPCRVVDTRQATGEFGGPPIQGNTSRSFPIPQNTTCNIPSSAAAYSLNVTVVPYTTLGYLTIWPTGESQPVVSTMNSTDGRIKANAAVVPAGGNGGAVSVYVTDTTNVILDIDGYFTTPGSGTYQFYPLTPCRIVDTRNGDGGMLQAGVERDYTIPPNCAVPSSATAYSFNVTVLPAAGGLDYLTVWPKGETQPVVSTLNDNTGTVVANAAIVPAGSENATAFYAHSNSTNLLVDVDGYFAAPGTGGLSLYPVAPCRVLDTRQSGGSFVGEKIVNVVGSTCAPPANAAAYIFNATVVPPGPMLFLTLWPDGEQQPTVSTLNAEDGFITSNMAIVPTNNGSIDAYAYALTQLILDISSYFAP
ncbi:MAG: choice-of-anchor tandem repeat GloVer-containing protein [Candidatus Korobacteraceae bacterium]